MTAERTREVPPEAVLPTAVLCGSRLLSGTGGLASSVCLGETGWEIGRKRGVSRSFGLSRGSPGARWRQEGEEEEKSPHVREPEDHGQGSGTSEISQRESTPKEDGVIGTRSCHEGGHGAGSLGLTLVDLDKGSWVLA